MFEIDRCLLIVKPKQPFLDWSQSIDYQVDLTLADLREDSTAYLIPEYEMISEQAEILEWCYQFVFEAELKSWYTDPELWPKERNLEMFLEWFDVRFHSLVFDLLKEPIEILDYGLDNDVEPGSNGN
ncbi:MAG TPA: hypothetical protein VEW46_06375 [Pyrinomonadaceae bacterium]|nr:hypothetical protein [Pyrinomonadaceae bacterium]